MQPSHAVAVFLRKSARIGSSSFFSEKKKLKSFEAVCVEHCWARSRDCKLVRCYAKRQSALPASRMRSRAQKDKNQICAGYAAAPSWKELYVSSRNEKPTTPTLAAHRDSQREVARCRSKTSVGMLCRTKEATALSM